MKKVNKLKGFTLVETILVVVLTFLILGCVFSVLGPMRSIYDDAYKTKDSMDINDFAGKAIERDLRYANRIYVYDGVKATNEENFMKKCVDTFRSDFLFTENTKYPDIQQRIFGNQNLDDVVYVMKLDCRDVGSSGVSTDGTSRGYISRYQYDKGILNTTESKVNLINPILFDDRNNNMGYSIDYSFGFKDQIKNNKGSFDNGINEGSVTDGINAENLCITLNTYKSKLIDISLPDSRSSVSTDFKDTYASQSVSFPLVNVAKGGKIVYESISYIKKDGGKVTPDTPSASLIDVPRFKYFDTPQAYSDEGTDIYFVYTEVSEIS